MAVFRGARNRDDTFVGGATADTFLFDPADLDARDVIVGGESGRRGDLLKFGRSGTIDADALAQVSQIERILLMNGTNALTLPDRLVASAAGQRIEVTGGAGDDTIDASQLAAGRSVSIQAGAGRDTLTGGAGGDQFSFALGELSASDRVVGGLGTDTLRIAGGGSVPAGMLSSVSGIETIVFGNEAVSVKLSQALLLAADGQRLSISTGRGADVIDARDTRTDFDLRSPLIELRSGAGDDTILGPSAGNGAGIVVLPVYIDAGAGADIIESAAVPSARIVYDGDDVRAYATGGTLLIDGRASIDLTRVSDQSLNDAAIVRGFVNADASLSRAAVDIVGLTASRVFGGAGADTLSGARFLDGGGGADTLIGTRDFNGTTFTIGDGDFAAGESILGQTGNDSLYVSGDADMTTGTVTGIRYLTLTLGDAGERGRLILGADQVSDLNFISGGGTIAIRLGDQHELVLGQLSGGSSEITLEVYGTSAADTITASYSGQDATIFGGGGGDTLAGGGQLFGGAGDDRIAYDRQNGGSQIIDGGGGNDTLTASNNSDIVVRFSSVDDQTLNDTTIVRGMENIDNSGYFAGIVDAIGSDSSNILIGGGEADRLDGGAGDDILEGGSGRDVLTGGAGADQFRFGQSPEMDTILDYTIAEDRLVFRTTENDETLYDFVGNRFDTRVVAADTSADLARADLIIYTASSSATTGDLSAFLRADGTGIRGEGVFIVAADGDGHTILYHTSDASGQNSSWNVIADLGTVPVSAITLADFSFI